MTKTGSSNGIIGGFVVFRVVSRLVELHNFRHLLTFFSKERKTFFLMKIKIPPSKVCHFMNVSINHNFPSMASFSSNLFVLSS